MICGTPSSTHPSPGQHCLGCDNQVSRHCGMSPRRRGRRMGTLTRLRITVRVAPVDHNEK